MAGIENIAVYLNTLLNADPICFPFIWINSVITDHPEIVIPILVLKNWVLFVRQFSSVTAHLEGQFLAVLNGRLVEGVHPAEHRRIIHIEMEEHQELAHAVGGYALQG